MFYNIEKNMIDDATYLPPTMMGVLCIQPIDYWKMAM